MKVLELYSGIGGMHFALAESGIPGDVVAAMDINTVANEVYKHNFPRVRNISRNIESLSAKEISDMNVDSIFMSPPCQPFTRVGLQKDAEDNRSSSLFRLLSIIPQIESLKHVLVENVKGFEGSQTRDSLVSCLEESGFNYKEIILSPCQFGVPNTRHRYYLLAKKIGLEFCFTDSSLTHCIPEEVMSYLPNDYHSNLARNDNGTCYRLEHIIDKTADTGAYSLPDRVLQKRASVLDVRTPESRGSCCFTKAYGRYVEGTGSVFSPLPRKIIDETFVKLQNRRDDSKDSLEPLIASKLRYFTPGEVSKLMCFPESFKFPNTITDKQKYRLLGNSINVFVVSRLIFLLNHTGNLSSTS